MASRAWNRVPPQKSEKIFLCHQADLLADAGDTDSVIAHGADDARHVGAVADGIERVGVGEGVAHEIVAGQVVHVSVQIVVDAVAGNFV